MIRRSNKGFTLVEIMIVVAIIGILIAIAVPGFLKARRTSRARACQENLTKAEGAMQQYIIEFNVADWAAGVGFVSDPLTFTGSDNYIRSELACPANGTYTYDADPAIAVTCSATSAAENADHTIDAIVQS